MSRLSQEGTQRLYRIAQGKEAARNVREQTRPVRTPGNYAYFKTKKEAKAHAGERGWDVRKVGLHWYSQRPKGR